jgi:hypothetical protein
MNARKEFPFLVKSENITSMPLIMRELHEAITRSFLKTREELRDQSKGKGDFT